VILGVIPARGGSKEIPRKNIKDIAGRPLFAWTIEAAKRSKLLDRFIVSTEDKEIAGVAKRYGAEVLERPPEFAGDEVTGLELLQHVISLIDADTIVLLQPTSPIRDNGLIDRCIAKFKETGADNLATGFICKFTEYGTNTKRRQDIKGFFYDDGSVYVIKAGLIKKGKLFGRKMVKVQTSREENIDVDDEFDFWVAEQVLLKRIKEKRQ
jgi:N-acylneuraminate cytidylyltransferase